MPSIVDIEETLTEIKELPTYKAPQSAPQRSSFLSKVAAALKSMTVQREHSPEFRECRAAYEMPQDILARKHPYMYADALLG